MSSRELLLVCLVSFVGCSSAPIEQSSHEATQIASEKATTGKGFEYPAEPAAEETLTLFDRTWLRSRQATGIYIANEVWLYECQDDPTVRLVLARGNKPAGTEFTIAALQVTVDGQEWKHNGAEWRWQRDPKLGHQFYDSHRLLGETHGMQTVWRDGQLQFRRNYLMGKQHGRSEGWYENGQKQFDSVYQLDKEVSGKLWREDGTLDE